MENKGNLWWKTSIIYQIYPLSFKDTNNDGKGDLRGIIEKLDYLNDGTEKSLGVDAIWLSPIYKSPMTEGGYDVSDYLKIDYVFGSEEDFDELISKAHERSMRVLMDFVPNHTSIEHPWFKEARSSRDNPKRDWYIWKDPKPDGSPPNNWLSVFGGPAWSFDAKMGQYYLHSFLPEQPELNWRNTEVINEMQKVLEFWMKRGVDGFRTDALYLLIEDDEFRDEPPNPDYKPGKDNPYDSLLHIYTNVQPDIVPSITKFCTVLGKEKGKLMIGEMDILSPDELLKFQRVCTEELYLPFNFNLIKLEWNARAYREFIDRYDGQLGEGNWPNYVLGNHDQKRVASRIGKDVAKVAAMLQLTLRGTPFIYYGEEIGMENTPISGDQVKDPWEKNVPGLGLGRDPERTPMQWSKNKFAGFSESKPWLPVNPNYKTVNVEEEEKESKSMFSLYKKLIWYRRESTPLLHGSYSSLDSGAEKVFAFIRTKGDKSVLIVLNFSNSEEKLSLKVEKKKAILILSTYMDKEGEEIDLTDFSLRPNEGRLFEL